MRVGPMRRAGGAVIALAVVAAACGGGGGDDAADTGGADAATVATAEDGDDEAAGASDVSAVPSASEDDDGATDTAASSGTSTDEVADDEASDAASVGLWDDGECDASLAPLVVGNIGPHESPVLSLSDHVAALEASAVAFNARGGANGTCIEVVACDDENNFDRALECARQMADSEVVATLNDADVTAAAEVSAALADAGIPRIGGNVAPVDWDDANSYPISTASAVTFLLPDALIQQGVDKIGMVRVDVPAAAAARALFEATYADDGATFPADVPVPAGTTDYTQFVLAAENAGANGVMLALGAQEAIQVARAAGDLGSDLAVSASLGSFSYTDVVDLGDVADQMIFVWPFPPATADPPVYEVLRADLAASGDDALQPEHLKTGAMMSWISMYALLEMIREAGLTDFTGESITALLDDADSVPMLGIFGDETWTPALDHEGAWTRVGIDRYTYWTWDPDAEWSGEPGNFVLGGEISFSDAMCGSAVGAPEPC